MVVAFAGRFASGRKWYLWVGQSVLFTLTEFGPNGIRGRNAMQLKHCTGYPTRNRIPKFRDVVKLGEAFLAIYDMLG